MCNIYCNICVIHFAIYCNIITYITCFFSGYMCIVNVHRSISKLLVDPALQHLPIATSQTYCVSAEASINGSDSKPFDM